jgi:FkbM family methyltransferase
VARAIQTELHDGDTFIDAGANIGYFTLIASDIVGGNGRVFAFEPDRTTFSTLLKNIRTNSCGNVVAFMKAVSDRTGNTTMVINSANRGENQVGVTSKSSPTIGVSCLALDDLGISEVNLIKLDIEGGEGHAIRGMKRIIEANENLKLIMELSPSLLERHGTSPVGLLRYLQSSGFHAQLLTPTRSVDMPNAALVNLAREQRRVNIFLSRSIKEI